MTKRLIFFGGSSELALRMVDIFADVHEVVVFSRKTLDDDPRVRYFTIDDYESKNFAAEIKDLPPVTETVIIFFNGISDSRPFYSLPKQEISTILSVNVEIPLLITQMFINTMIGNEIRFIYFGSTRAELGDKGIVMYSATKAALRAAIKSLALEYGKINKFFYLVSLGIFDHGLISSVPDSKIGDIMKRSAIGEFVDTEALKNCIEFIMENKSMTGSVLYCDNGYH
jgi:NAD(P)-dependent dehydrogenase (short-subunit alcohol dehydrogenase family)